MKNTLFDHWSFEISTAIKKKKQIGQKNDIIWHVKSDTDKQSSTLPWLTRKYSAHCGCRSQGITEGNKQANSETALASLHSGRIQHRVTWQAHGCIWDSLWDAWSSSGCRSWTQIWAWHALSFTPTWSGSWWGGQTLLVCMWNDGVKHVSGVSIVSCFYDQTRMWEYVSIICGSSVWFG